MLTFLSLISTVALFAALMIPGFIMGKMKRIEKNALATVGNILSDIAMPALVAVKLLETDVTSLDPVTLLLCVLIPTAVILSLYFISRLVFRPNGSDEEHRSARFCSVFSNCGFLGIPLASALFPSAPEVTVYVSIANVISSFFFLTLGMDILTVENGGRKRSPLWALLRPVTFAVIFGFVFSALGVGRHFPTIISYLSPLSQLTTPLSMTVLGFELSRMKARELFGDARVYMVATVKLILSPTIAFVILIILKYAMGVGISYYFSSAMLITTAISTAASVSAMARAKGINGSLAAAATLVNTMLCVITLPLLWMVFDAAL